MHIRHVGALLAGLATLFSFALPVFANTTQLSSNPSYAAQPFSYYCHPYLRSFETDKHYVAQNGGCAYSVPNAITGSVRGIALYKGVPGTSTFVAGDQIFGSPTLVQEDNTFFGAPVQEDQYFAVIYGANTPAELAQFGTAFTVGSSTNTLPPNNNYQLLRWKWGAKPASEYEPVVVVPDMLNSWTKDTGLVVDPIFKSYQNLTDTFVANGYILGQNLFLFPYNWEDSMSTNAQALAAKIAAIKVSCGCSYVDVIAHGTGGLIATKYVESAGYQNDVDQLLLLGTPFFGIPSAYKALEGGQIAFGNSISDGLAQALINQEAKDGGYTNAFNYIQQKPATAFAEIVPAYTNYLLDAGFNELPYPSGYPQNTFLEGLISNLTPILSKIRMQTVLSDDGLGQTPSSFAVGTSVQPPLWPHGQPLSTLTDLGDGLVTRFSIENLVSTADFEVSGSHRAIPTNAQSTTFNALNNKNPSPTVNNNYPVSCVLFISSSVPTDMQITDPNGLRLGKDFTNNTTLTEIPNAIYSGFAATTEYGVIANPINGTYTVQTRGSGDGSFTINTSDVCTSGIVSTSTSAVTSSGQLIGYGLDVSTTTQTLTLSPLDTSPPVITITNPIAGASYFDNASVFLSATITDVSAIAATAYALNGNVIDPGQPLPLLTAPLGTSTVSVAATDVFGNAASTTLTFFIKSSDTQPPTIVITNPLAGQTYPNTAIVIPAATITDPSGVATSTFYLNGSEIDRTQPLPLSTTAAGTAVLRVSATDNFGNASSTSVTFTVTAPASPDTQGPIITIIKPEQGKLYPRSEKIFVLATFSDQSPIVSKKYYLNGKNIDPAKPLYFKTAPLGTSTLVIKAKDSYGNVGYATSTFRVIPGNDTCIKDITEGLDRKWIQDKKTFTKLFKYCKELEDYRDDEAHGHNHDEDIDRVCHDIDRNIKRNEEDDRRNEWGKWNDNDDD